MPRICEFGGVRVLMYFGDHNPPHFHAKAGGDEALVEIETGLVAAGTLSRADARVVERWRIARLEELRANWLRATAGVPLMPIDPLD